MEVQYAADSEEDYKENGPQVVVLTAQTPEDRQALAALVRKATVAIELKEQDQ